MQNNVFTNTKPTNTNISKMVYQGPLVEVSMTFCTYHRMYKLLRKPQWFLHMEMDNIQITKEFKIMAPNKSANIWNSLQ